MNRYTTSIRIFSIHVSTCFCDMYCFFIAGTILRRWKKNWFDLYSDGRLVFYNDQQRRDLEDDIHMKIDCINIRSSSACQGAQQMDVWY